MAERTHYFAFNRTYTMGEEAHAHSEVRARAEQMAVEQVRRDILKNFPDAKLDEPTVSEWTHHGSRGVDPETGEEWSWTGWSFTAEIMATTVATTEGAGT